VAGLDGRALDRSDWFIHSATAASESRNMIQTAELANKRLVILGCGYLGGAVARAAAAAGMRVEALTRNRERAAELERLGVTVVVDDLAADAWHPRLAPGPDHVLDCVGAGGGGLDGYRHSYRAGMRSLLEWTRSRAAGLIIFTSSTAVYPQGGGTVVDEDAPTEAAGPPGRILLEAEALLRETHAARRRAVVLRLAGLYGPERHHLLDQVRAGAADVAGEGAHHLNLAHRDDAAAAVMALLAAPGGPDHEVFNVADDAAGTKAEVVGWLAERLGRPAPRFAGGAASRREGFAAPPDRIISNARLKARTGWRPRYPTFREGYAAILSA